MKNASARVLAIWAALTGANAMAIETPKFKLLEKTEHLEVREYPSYVVAETEVEGEKSEVGNEAFRRLAGYIFGNNRRVLKIEMTAPVTQAMAEGTRIEMTAPVTQVPRGANRWQVQFMMPAGWTLDSLPEPKDSRVKLRVLQPRKVAAIRYSGTWSQANYRAQLEKLRASLARKGLRAKGEPIWARYDPPWKPWFLRRNEILLELDAPPSPGLAPADDEPRKPLQER